MPEIDTRHLTTPGLALPYPQDTDAADVPADILALDNRIEALYGAPNGFASLDSSGHVPASELGVGTAQLDYAQITNDVTISAAGIGGAQTIITGNTVAYQNRPVKISVFLPGVEGDYTDNNGWMYVVLLRDANVLGRAGVGFQDSRGFTASSLYFMEWVETPAAGNHVYAVKGYSHGVPAWTVHAGAGGGDVYLPAYLRVQST